MIIPLGPGLLRDSSSLPEGSSKHSFECSHPGWASPPLLFDLAPRGVFRAPDVATRAVGSYPTFSPLPNVPTVRGAPQVLPAACRRGSSVTGGLFSVALSVAALQTCLRMPQTQPPGVTRRVALHPERQPMAASRLWSPDFPPAHLAFAKRTGDHPAHPLNELYAVIQPTTMRDEELDDDLEGIRGAFISRKQVSRTDSRLRPKRREIAPSPALNPDQSRQPRS